MKRIQALVLFLLAACATAPVQQPTEPVQVVLVATTDVHGWFNGHVEGASESRPEYSWGGLPILASYVDALRAAHPGRVILVDSGDMFQGTLESNLNEGEAMIRGYNMVGYAAAAVGNHEFDFGPLGPDAVARKAGDDPLGALKRNAAIAKFPLLSANLVERATGRIPPWARPYTIVEAGGAKVGIIGLSTPDTPNVTMAANVAMLDFTDPVAATVRAAAELRSQGVDAIVVVAHMGGRCSKTDEPHAVESCDRQQEAMRLLETLPAGTIDAYFGGHTHSRMRHFVNGVPAAEGLPYSREFSTIELWIDTRTDRVLRDRSEIRPHTMLCVSVWSGTETCDPRSAPEGATLVPRTFAGREIRPDSRVAATVEPFMRAVASKRVEPLGIRTAEPIDRSFSSESALGNLIADTLRVGTGADFAFMNSGGIRANLRAGDLVYSDIFEVSPFDNFPAVVTMTGAQVVQALRDVGNGDRGFLQVSGLRYTLDASKDDRLVSVTLSDGTPLDPARLYTVVMPDFLSAGGDGMNRVVGTVPAENIRVMYEAPIREMLIQVLQRRAEPITPKLEGRLTVLNAPTRPGR
ncbi:MAG: bifunctional UDP-sugar hydrolase/5'-nucleotidase [Thermoanaerobaculia bacterium]